MRKTMPQTEADARHARRSLAFTLIELLVVISIIAILMAILLPALNYARQQGYVTATSAELHDIQTGCESYYQAYNAYPGPLSEAQVSASAQSNQLTGTQNLLWGLTGFWSPTATSPSYVNPASNTTTYYYQGTLTPVAYTGGTIYVGTQVGDGQLNYATGTMGAAYWQPGPGQTGFVNNSLLGRAPKPGTAGAGGAAAPTILDSFPDAMPILYYRKTPGADTIPVYNNQSQGIAAFYQNCNAPYYNSTNMEGTSGPGNYVQEPEQNPPSLVAGQYCSAYSDKGGGTANENLAYTVVNKTLMPPGSSTYDMPNSTTIGGFVLIAAGANRIYGPALSTTTVPVAGSPIMPNSNPPSSFTDDDIVVAGAQ